MILSKNKIPIMLTVALLTISIFAIPSAMTASDESVGGGDVIGDININHLPTIEIIRLTNEPWLWSGDLFEITIAMSDKNGLSDIPENNIKLELNGVRYNFTRKGISAMNAIREQSTLEFIVPEKNRLHGNSTTVRVTVMDRAGASISNSSLIPNTFFNPRLSFSVNGHVEFAPGDVGTTVQSNLRTNPSYPVRRPLNWQSIGSAGVKPLFLEYLRLSYGITWENSKNVIIERADDLPYNNPSRNRHSIMLNEPNVPNNNVTITVIGDLTLADYATICGRGRRFNIPMNSGNILYMPIANWWAMSAKHESEVNLPMQLSVMSENFIGINTPEIYINATDIIMNRFSSKDGSNASFRLSNEFRNIGTICNNEVNFFNFHMTYPNVPKNTYRGRIFFRANWII
jgi:hypothetical protein